MFVAALCGRGNASCHSPRQERTSGLRPRPEGWGLHLGGAGKSMFFAFGYGVMYVLSFATIITVFATAIALAVLLVMIACRKSRQGAACRRELSGRAYRRLQILPRQGPRLVLQTR